MSFDVHHEWQPHGTLPFIPLERLVWPCLELIEDAANYLVQRGYLDPEDDLDAEDEVVAELIEIAKEGACGVCPGWPSGDALAEHFLSRKQHEYERSLPVWTCDCGTAYKILPEYRFEQFYALGDDGWLGDPAGGISRDGKGRAKESSSCPCGRKFADTIARQLDPQPMIFDLLELA